MKVHIGKDKFLFFLVAYIMFPFAGLVLVDQRFVYARDVCAMIAFLVVFYLAIKRLNIKYVYTLFLYYGYLIINTLVNKGDFVQLSVNLFSEMGVFLFVIYAVQRGKYRDMIMAFSTLFSIELFVNLLHMLTTDIGFGLTRASNKTFILASDNALMQYVIIFVVVHELRNEIEPYGFLRDFLFYGVILVELIIGESATSIFVAAMMLLCVLVYRRISLNKYLYLSGSIILFLNFFLIFVRKLKFMEDVFQKLGKDTTLSGRDHIWDRALLMILQSPIFGYGVSNNLYYVSNYKGGMIMEAHNMLLNCMLQGGVIFLALFLFMIIVSCHRIKNVKTRQASCLAMGLICFWIEFLVESPTSCPGFFMLLALCQFGGKIRVR